MTPDPTQFQPPPRMVATPPRRRTVASYDSGGDTTVCVDPVTVGDLLPDVPLFLAPSWYVNIPLEATYRTSWEAVPQSIRDLVM